MKIFLNFFKKKVPIKGEMELYYDAHKGEKAGGGIICGYNEKRRQLIIETENGYWGKDYPHAYDEIFSYKKTFKYIPKP